MQIPAFEQTQQKQLQKICSDDSSDCLHSYDFIHGLLFAVAAAPEIPMPTQWMMWVFKKQGQLQDQAHTDKLTGLLMSLFRYHLQNMRDDIFIWPEAYSFPKDHAITSSTSQWCRGLLAGHSQLEPVWEKAWQKLQQAEPENMGVIQDKLRHALSMISTFADLPLAVSGLQGDKRENLIKQLPTIYLSLPGVLKTYVEISGKLVGHLPDQFETFIRQPD